ncbi:hypothetical protein Tco_1241307 [Tanacetum coccineum]
MMLERYNQHAIDPLAFVSNVSPQLYPIQSSIIPQSTYVPPVNHQPQFSDNTQLDSRLTLTDDLIENLTKTVALLAQSYKTYFPQTNNQLRTSSNIRNQATVQNGRVVVQNVQGRLNRVQGNYARGEVAAGNRGVQNRVGNEYFKDKMQLMQAQENRVVLDEEQFLFIAGGQTNTFDDDVDEAPVQDLALNEDNVFQADKCDAFDSDVDEAPTAQTMFMKNLSSANPIYDNVGPSYDSDILSEVQDHDNYLDSVGEYHEVHEMQNDVQPNYIVDSDAEYTSDRNIILCEKYAAQCVFANEQNKVVKESLTAELARYKEQVEVNEKMARFELTEREQKIDEQMRIIITDQHFEGIQMALVKEVKEMKEIFEQMEAEVDQNVVDKKSVEIERKNLLIENENLIADCLSNELLYSVMNDVNIVSRFSKLHDAYTVGQARCLELEAEISKLKHKIKKDDHSEMIKRFSNLEIDHLNLQLKYQNIKERFGHNKSQTSQDTPEFD